MIRIITADGKESTKLTVEGTLSDKSLEAVQACCIQALSTGNAVRLWLSDVSAIGERGRTILQRLVAAGVDLTARHLQPLRLDETRSAGPKERRGSR